MSLRLLLFFAILAVFSRELPPAGAQSTPPTTGLRLPAGPIIPGRDQAVTTADDAGHAVVGRAVVNVGDQRLVMLPDGQLVVRSAELSPVTDRPFAPVTKEALVDRLASEFKGFRIKSTRRFIYVHNTSDEFALATSRIMETMFPGVFSYVERLGVEVHEPEFPLVVIMFRTEAEFQRFRRMPAGILAYYDVLSNRVVMKEESGLAGVKRELALQQSIATIAHEGVHQILANIGFQQRLARWPMWLSEGLAEYFAPTSTARRLKWKGAGRVNDLRMYELEELLKSQSSDQTAGELIAATVSAARLESAGYASAWALTHFLAKARRKELASYLRETAAIGPLEGAAQVVAPGVIPRDLELFRRHFGDDLAELERLMRLHLGKLPYDAPFAEFPHYAALVVHPDGRREQRTARVFHSSNLAENWAGKFISDLPGDERPGAKAVVRRFANRPQAEFAARQWLGQQ